jgi:hypothetical protein
MIICPDNPRLTEGAEEDVPKKTNSNITVNRYLGKKMLLGWAFSSRFLIVYESVTFSNGKAGTKK